jgi:hypothetical protein
LSSPGLGLVPISSPFFFAIQSLQALIASSIPSTIFCHHPRLSIKNLKMTMFSKILASSVFVLALCHQVASHAIVTPALGVKGTAKRADVQRPNSASPCGAGVNDISTAIDSAMTVVANANGSFQVTGTSFNGGNDGSLQFKGQVDSSGNGTHFVSMPISMNGNNSPPGAESTMIVASLPPGTKCTGGKSGNLCLAQFISGAGFGSCVVVSQATADAGTPTTTMDAGNSTAVVGAENPASPTNAGGCPAIRPTSTVAARAIPHAGSLLARSLLANRGNA